MAYNRSKETSPFAALVGFSTRLGKEKLLTTHQTREAEVPIPVIARYLDAEITATMTEEHQDISKVLLEITNEIAALERESDHASLETTGKTVEKLNALTRKHFSREENVVFWFASLRLSESDSTEIARNIEKIDSDP